MLQSPDEQPHLTLTYVFLHSVPLRARTQGHAGDADSRAGQDSRRRLRHNARPAGMRVLVRPDTLQGTRAVLSVLTVGVDPMHGGGRKRGDDIASNAPTFAVLTLRDSGCPAPEQLQR